jgi:hypothetical protein
MRKRLFIPLVAFALLLAPLLLLSSPFQWQKSASTESTQRHQSSERFVLFKLCAVSLFVVAIRANRLGLKRYLKIHEHPEVLEPIGREDSASAKCETTSQERLLEPRNGWRNSVKAKVRDCRLRLFFLELWGRKLILSALIGAQLLKLPIISMTLSGSAEPLEYTIPVVISAILLWEVFQSRREMPMLESSLSAERIELNSVNH